MNCPNCGTSANENDRFCVNCGTLLRKPQPVAEPAAKEAASGEPVIIPAANEPEPDFKADIEKASTEVKAAIKQTEASPAEAAKTAAEASRPVITAVEAPKPEPVPEPSKPAIGQVQTVEVSSPSVESDAEVFKNRIYKPLSTWGYIWRILLFAIPIINIIPLFIMAFSSGINKNSKHFASATLILMLLGLVGLVVGGALLIANTDPDTITQFINRVFYGA